MQQYDDTAEESFGIMVHCSVHQTPEVIQHFSEVGIVAAMITAGIIGVEMYRNTVNGNVFAGI